jgi:AcrR family transcriptional regulator
MTGKRLPARERLLDAADRLFYAEGVHRVGIDRVIEDAGVAKGSLFYNFTGKDDLVAAYLAARDERRRARTRQVQEGLEDPVERMLAVFDVLHEAATTPGYNGCPFANANAEATSDGVEARALRTHRDWLSDLLLTLAQEAGYTAPGDVVASLRLLYDGAATGAHLDGHTDAVLLARDLARDVLARAPRTDPGIRPGAAHDQAEVAGARG